jgi:hypothetical protein
VTATTQQTTRDPWDVMFDLHAQAADLEAHAYDLEARAAEVNPFPSNDESRAGMVAHNRQMAASCRQRAARYRASMTPPPCPGCGGLGRRCDHPCEKCGERELLSALGCEVR